MTTESAMPVSQIDREVPRRLDLVDTRDPQRSDGERAPVHPFRGVVPRLLLGYAAMAAVMLSIGFILTHLLASSVGRWDEHVNIWFAHRRRPPWDGITEVFTWMLNTVPVVVAAVVVVGGLWLRSRRRDAVLLAAALVLEITVFLSVTFVVARPRPHVQRMNLTPSTSSFPSGHTAAATVFFVGLALIVWHATERQSARRAAALVAAIVVVAVGFARVYRGLHHPTDVACGVLLGLACLAVASYALRAVPVTKRADRSPTSS
jgi:membrane-associated phospholipid phosphatase